MPRVLQNVRMYRPALTPLVVTTIRRATVPCPALQVIIVPKNRRDLSHAMKVNTQKLVPQNVLKFRQDPIAQMRPCYYPALQAIRVLRIRSGRCHA